MKAFVICKLWAAAFLLLLVAVVVQADPRLWDENGVAVRQGRHLQPPSRVSNDAGQTLIVWSDARAGTLDIYAQLFSAGGVPLWTPEGVLVCNATGRQAVPVACAVTGGWIVAWTDSRSAGADWYGDVYAQKLGPDGTRLWPADNANGVLVDATDWPNETTLRVVTDGEGGALMAWSSFGSVVAILAQRVQAGGTVAWPAALQVSGEELYSPQELLGAGDGAGNLLVAWRSYQSATGADVFAAKVTPAGELAWGTAPVLVCNANDDQRYIRLCPDGENGCYIGWGDSRSGPAPDLYLQRLNAAGQPQWTANGIVLCAAPHDQEELRLVLSRNGTTPDGCLAVWEDPRVNNTVTEIFGQKISPAGSMLWGADGIRICGNAGGVPGNPTGDSRSYPDLVSDDEGGLICAWEDYRDSPDWYYSDLYAMRMLANGTRGWDETCGLPVTAGDYEERRPLLSMTGSHALVFYQDHSQGSPALHYQRLDVQTGNLELGPSETEYVAGLSGSAYRPQTVALANGRVATVWRDTRAWRGGATLYYQIFDSTGQFEQPRNGEWLITDNEGYNYADQDNHRLCSDGGGGFFAVFEDLRTGTKQLRVSHVNSAGENVGNPAGQVVSVSLRDQVASSIIPDGAGGCYVAWSEYDDNYLIDAYVLRMNADGSPAWGQPTRLTQTVDDDFVVGLAPSASGCGMVLKSGTYDGDTLRVYGINADGAIGWQTVVTATQVRHDHGTMIADGLGGFYLAWVDDPYGSALHGLYVQHLNTAGVPLWMPGGIPVRQGVNLYYSPALDTDSQHNLVMGWQEYEVGAQAMNLYAQKWSLAGAPLWGDNGIAVCTEAGDQEELRVISDGADGWLLVWRDGRAYPASLYGVHLDANGVPAGDPYWVAGGSPVSLPLSGGWLSVGSMSVSHPGSVILVWMQTTVLGEDDYVEDLRAQRIYMTALGAPEPPSGLPQRYALYDAYPNPFNPTTTIAFDLPVAGMVKLAVYDLLGREVALLEDRMLTAGTHTRTFDASALASGVYFYRLEAGAFTATHKLVLLK